MRKLVNLALVFGTTVLLALACYAQAAPEKKSYVFHGKVDGVDKTAKTLSVNNEKIEGWMEAMIMVYPVDDPSIIDKLKPGDQITATVYDGDYTLHQVKLVGKDAAKKESKK